MTPLIAARVITLMSTGLIAGIFLGTVPVFPEPPRSLLREVSYTSSRSFIRSFSA